ncbi:MAG: FtsQ-type POTRA domain-containing protein [Vulcanimicrobiaceae bacterium]
MSSGARSRPRVLPRRRKPSVAARARPFWVLAALALAVLVAVGAWLAQAPFFRITHVGIEVPLGSPVSVTQVRTAAAIAPEANLWLLSPGAIARRIEAIPYVDRASIHRLQFPAPSVELGITVRRPAFCWQSGGAEVTLDDTGRVLQLGCIGPASPRLIAVAAPPSPGETVTDPGVVRLLTDAATLAGAGLSMRRLGWDRWGGLEGVDASGVILRLGDDADLAAKAALVGPVRAGIGAKRTVRAIDLRAPGTPTVEFR